MPPELDPKNRRVKAVNQGLKNMVVPGHRRNRTDVGPMGTGGPLDLLRVDATVKGIHDSVTIN